jgi:hypothetical protein
MAEEVMAEISNKIGIDTILKVNFYLKIDFLKIYSTNI